MSQPTITTIATIGSHEGTTITLRGWLYNLRASGKLLFPIFRDGTGTIQGIVPKAAVPEEVFETLKNLTLESSLIVTGKVRADSRAPSGFELDVENIEVIQRVDDATPFPISLKEHGVDFLMEHRHLWIRTPRQSAILRVRATIMRAAAEYFDTNGFTRTDPPILTPAACEGTSELFEMDYFDDKAYLTQSGQLYIESTALALGKVYSFGPTFRAEKSKTRRHLTEFWMIEPEVAYCGLPELMELAENFISHIVSRVLESHRADLKVIGRDVDKLETIKAPFPKISYDEAHQMLEDAFEKGLIENRHTYGDDFGSPDETYISNQYDRPVMVHRYPAAVKAFYMEPDAEDPTKALCVDVLAPEGYGEIIGGSQRVDSYDLLRQRILDHNLPLEAFEWYLDLRRYGSVPHSGFGMGIERAVAWICGLDHVRETIPLRPYSQPHLPMIPYEQQAQPDEQIEKQQPRRRVDGWLLFFCIAVMMGIARSLPTLTSTKTLPFLSLHITTLVVSLIMVFSIWVRASSALTWVRLFLATRTIYALIAVYQGIRLSTPSVESSMSPSDREFYRAAGTMLSVMTCYFYFHISTRVRETFGRNL